MTDKPPTNKKDEVLRYIALLASRITLGESDPSQVNWRYLRDQTMAALCEAGSAPQAVVTPTQSRSKVEHSQF